MRCQDDGMEGTDAEPLLDLSRYLGIILAMEPGIRERGSGFTCVTTGEDILWLDELAGGRIMVRIPHHLGYDRSLKIKVEQFGTGQCTSYSCPHGTGLT